MSHLSFLSKVLEQIVAGQLNDHLVITNIHDEFQSAYRPGFSNFDDILRALDNKCFTAFIMIDMSAAFDTIDQFSVILVSFLSAKQKSKCKCKQ